MRSPASRPTSQIKRAAALATSDTLKGNPAINRATDRFLLHVETAPIDNLTRNRTYRPRRCAAPGLVRAVLPGARGCPADPEHRARRPRLPGALGALERTASDGSAGRRLERPELRGFGGARLGVPAGIANAARLAPRAKRFCQPAEERHGIHEGRPRGGRHRQRRDAPPFRCAGPRGGAEQEQRERTGRAERARPGVFPVQQVGPGRRTRLRPRRGRRAARDRTRRGGSRARRRAGRRRRAPAAAASIPCPQVRHRAGRSFSLRSRHRKLTAQEETDDRHDLTWLGHAAFRIDTAAASASTSTRGCTATRSAPKRAGARARDIVAVTHGHGDHVGDTVAISNQHGATVVALLELGGWLGKQGVAEDKVHRVQQGRDSRRRRREVHAHERVPLELRVRRLVRRRGGRIRVEAENGTTLYFAGDTCVFSDMQLIGRIYSPTSRSSRSATTTRWARARRPSRSSCSACSAASRATGGRSRF